MAHAVRMPDLGQTTDELRIVAWLKAEDERIEAGEPLFEVETDKTTLAVEAAVSGTLLRIVRSADETVEAGSVIAYVGAPGELVPEAGEETRVEQPRAVEKTAPAPAPSDKPIATPVARQLARERGIDLRLVRGTGPGGLIDRRDVLAFLDDEGA